MVSWRTEHYGDLAVLSRLLQGGGRSVWLPDNRMDKVRWNELWMGYPVDESYSRSSNVDNAHLLKGDLLLINGELDDNVDPASTLQVVDALVKADKMFEQLYLLGRDHALGKYYELHRLYEFFNRKLKNR